MSADDDGFSNQVAISMFRAHASVQDLQALLEQRYIYQFESGVIVIKHWRMANALRKDRYTQTVFKEELAKLKLDKNGAYSLEHGSSTVAGWLPGGCQTDAELVPQDRLDQDRLSQNNDVKRKRFIPPTIEDVKAYCVERKNNVDAQRFVDYYESNGWMVGRNKMKDWKAAVRTWEKTDNNKPKNSAPVIPVPDYMRKQIDDMERDQLLKEINNLKGSMHD